MKDIKDTLVQRFGFKQFRAGQQQTIEQLLKGQSTLSVFPTGAGKSLCYQLSALHLPHLTLVVSPLLALMKDQRQFLEQKGIACACVDSTLSPLENSSIMDAAKNGDIKILMISVERFKNERFRRAIENIPISLMVIDEAHCISEWGHNFRPDYLKIPLYQQQLNIPMVLLLTATATRKVKKDMVAKFSIDLQNIVQTGFYRKNLDLSVEPVSSALKNNKLVEIINANTGSGIVYVTLQKTAENVAQFLKQAGISAEAYHAGFENDKRVLIQNNFMDNNIQIVVATIAFGMGIDKSNIRFVIHYNLPKSIENYSQEIGRAGRDGLQSNCVTLANLDGITILENFVYGGTPEQDDIDLVLEDIKKNQIKGRWEMQIVSLSNLTNVKQLPLKTLLVQLELMEIIKPLYSYFAEIRLKLLQSESQIVDLFHDEKKEFIQSLFNHLTLSKIWGVIDINNFCQNYGCDRNRVLAALEFLQQKKLIVLESKRLMEAYEIDETKINAVKISEKLYQYFVDKEQKELARIDQLIRFFELDKCLSHNLSVYFDDAHSPENCNHCSVCRGQPAHLQYSNSYQFPEDDSLIIDLSCFIDVAQNKLNRALSKVMCCRFLAGITTPVFRLLKPKSHRGFGCCENIAYAKIKHKVDELWEELV